MSAKYACIAQYRTEYPVCLMCRVLAVSRAGFYAAQARGLSARAQADERDRLAVRATFAAKHARYGAPRVHRALAQAGTPVSLHRVARLMHEDGLQARRPRAFVRTTDSAHADPIAPNRLDRAFAVGPVPSRVRHHGGAGAHGARPGGGHPATRRRSPASFRSRESIHERRGSSAAAGDRGPTEHESRRELLGQRGRRELLRDPRVGTARDDPVSHARGRGAGADGVHRGMVQPGTVALESGVSLTCAVRTIPAGSGDGGLNYVSIKSG